MTPEEAQQKTEAKWKAIAGGDKDIRIGAGCSWCKFADSSCLQCPVYRTHGTSCGGLAVLIEASQKELRHDISFEEDDWLSFLEAAQEVYRYLLKMGPTYIAKAKEMQHGE